MPPASERPGRLITIKDVTGLSAIHPITISTQGGNTFDNGSNIYTISYPYSAITFIGRTNNWLKTGTSEPTTSTPTLTVSGDIQANTDVYITGFEYVMKEISAPTISTLFGLISTGTTSNQYVTAAGLSTVSEFTSNTSNWAANAFQDWSTPLYLFATFSSNTSNWAANILQDWSTPVSSVADYTSNTSNWAAGFQQDWSTVASTVAEFTSNTSNWAVEANQDWSTPVSTVALFTSNTSNWAVQANQDWSTPVSTATEFTSNTSNWFSNTFQDWSTPTSTVALFTSNTSNWTVEANQDWSTPVSTVSLFTSNTSNWAVQANQDWSTPVSTVARYTSNTSNWASNISQDWSTPTSTIAEFTSNTSNWASNAFQDWSTVTSTIALFTSNTSNYYANTTTDLSTPFSTLAHFTSNTSNWAYTALQDWSSPVSTVSLFTSNTSNFYYSLTGLDISTTIQSTTDGLGTIGYISSAQLLSTMIGFTDYVSSQIGLPGVNTTGTVLYLNQSVTVSPYKGLQQNPAIVGATVDILTVLDALTSNQIITEFQSDFTLPLFINEGVWDLNLFTSSDTPDISLYCSLFVRDSLGNETLIGTSSDNDTPMGNLIQKQNIISVFVPYTNLDPTSTLVFKIFGNNPGATANFHTYYQNSSYSRIITTLGTLVPATTLTSTVDGLGTAGYISTAYVQDLSNWAANISQDWSTAVSTVATLTSNTSNWASNILQDWSTVASTVAQFTSNTSNYYANGITDLSTPFSTLALFTSNTSNWSSNILQDWSTPVSTATLFTSNTSNWASNILQDWSTPVSTVATYTSNTSNWAANAFQDWSTPVSTATLFTSNTSNWASNAFQDWSTSVSTATLFTSNTSNWAANIRQDWSTPVSSVATYTSNTSNWAANAFQDWSTPVSTIAGYTSNILQDWSTVVSTVSQYTSNTSNWASNAFQDWSTPVSTATLYTSNTSNHFQALIGSSISISTANVTTSTLSIIDSITANTTGLIYQQSSLLYFNQFVIGGAFCLYSDEYGSVPFDPTTITSLNLWLDAQDPTTIATSGSVVTSWADKSGRSLSAVPIGINVPLYYPTYLPYVNFNSGQSLAVANWGYTTGWSVFVCMNTVILNPRWLISPYPDVNLIMMGMAEGTSKIFNAYLPGAPSDVTGAHIEYTTAQDTNDGASAFAWWRDGTLQTLTETSAGVPVNPTASLGIGGNIDGSADIGGQYQIYEILVFNIYLSTQERQTIEGYLAWKWGLQTNLPTNHPWRYSEP